MTNDIEQIRMSEKDVIEYFCKNLVEALGFAENQNVDFAKIIAVAIWNITEFGMYHTKGNLPIVSSVIIETVAASGLRRVDLSSYAPANKISIKSEGISLENKGNPATVLLLINAMEMLEEFISNGRPSSPFH